MGHAAPNALQDDRYLVLGALGRGGMARVFRAFDRVEQRIVALKVHDGRGPSGPDHPSAEEFEAWSRLSHPNVVRAYDLGLARRGPLPRGTPYLVLEHVDGGPIHEQLRPGRTGAEALCQVTVQILRGLDHIHSQGLVHRDMKPGNVLLEWNGNGVPRVKLTDFGLAADRGTVEDPGTFSGSLPFVSPEALLGCPLDGRADLYGLGVLLYHLATGRMPVVPSSVDAILRWHLAGGPADPREARPDLPQRLAQLVRRLTERPLARRPTDAGDALRLLGSPVEPIAPGSASMAGRAELAKLRLALDATHRGQRRQFLLPGCARASGALLRSAHVFSGAHGLEFHRLNHDHGDGSSALGKLALRLLVGREQFARSMIRRYSLDRLLPLRVLSGTPLWDHARASRGKSIAATEAHDRMIVRFLLDCATRQGIVLHAGTGLAGRRVLRVIDGLRREISSWVEGAVGGGFLLILDP